MYKRAPIKPSGDFPSTETMKAERNGLMYERRGRDGDNLQPGIPYAGGLLFRIERDRISQTSKS